MKPGNPKIILLTVILMGILAAVGWLFFGPFQNQPGKGGRAQQPAPVEVAHIEHGPIALKRTFSGELEALAEFVVAPKVSGRVERVLVNIADMVGRGQVVAELDNDEYVQAVAQAQADLAVARANLSEAASSLKIANREFKRTESLLKRGIASDSEFDATQQELLAKQAQLKVAEAQVMKFESALESANIRLGYTQVTAGWTGSDEQRVVAERYVDEGQTVAANTPLLMIVDLDPIVGIVFVTERDYANMKPGQSVTLTTDAYPGEAFTGRIDPHRPGLSQGHPPGAGRDDRRQPRPPPQARHVHPGHGGAGPGGRCRHRSRAGPDRTRRPHRGLRRQRRWEIGRPGGKSRWASATTAGCRWTARG